VILLKKALEWLATKAIQPERKCKTNKARIRFTFC
jgi:hypothetical protein